MSGASAAIDRYVAWRFDTPPRRCSYVPTETASLSYRISSGMPGPVFAELLRRGWRRHGVHLFRPGCPACLKCRSIRVDVENFAPSHSQRRCRRRNAPVEVILEAPTVTAQHVALYNAWHADMSARRGWPLQQLTAEEYAESFLAGSWEFAREMRYLEAGRLVGVGLVDVVDEALSSVYFYHAPDWRPRGPGTFSALCEIDLCRRSGRRWCYLGYWIAECPSMAYKNRFRPHEILESYVAEHQEPVWRPGTQ